MRPDGDPEPDDYGLPHVDVVVPDDARELDRDIIAYRREERQRRRRERLRRLSRPLTRFGVAVPVIAGALLIALISGALITVFGPRPAPRPTGALLAPHPTASPGLVGGMLPRRDVVLAGRDRRTVPLRSLRPGVIGIVSPGCRCESLVAELAGRAREFQLNFWLTADRREDTAKEEESLKALRELAGAARDGTPRIVMDEQDVLSGAYGPRLGPGQARAGLTAVLVQPDGVVADVLRDPRPGPGLTDKVKSLPHS